MLLFNKPKLYIHTNADITQSLYTGEEMARLSIQNLEASDYEIPKVFYTYWHTQEIPKLLQDCIKTWQRYNPDYDVVVITRTTVESVTNVRTPPNFDQMSRPYQADWVRLAVLLRNGGVWVDTSFIMTGSIQPLLDIQKSDKSEGFQFFMDKFTTHPSRPYLENWFIAAIPKAKYIAYWFLEFNKCFEEFGMKDEYLLHLQAEYGSKVYSGLIQASDSPSYLKQHICLQKVLLVDKIIPPSSLSALKPPFGPFFALKLVGWDSWELVKQLVQEYNPWYMGNSPRFIKLTSYERDIMRMQILEGKEVLFDLGFEWLLDMGLWQASGKRMYQTSRRSFYCSFVGRCNRGEIPALPGGYKAMNILASYWT